ncbi:MAG TPA: cyclic nucleotide-binding and patatin-like phospholipase domain-containing protein [Vicinamibacterales bacterium]|nr:cyclic nucleotide-binding and patatin-like phospholipase domain-containing protein [Vicinamibacterales bacterium]
MIPHRDVLSLAATLRSTDVFGVLEDGELRSLAAGMPLVSLSDGELLLEQDRASDALYVVLSGVLETATVDRHGSPHHGEVGPGGIVGEVSLFSKAPAAASVRARGDADVAALTRAGFDRFARSSPAGALQIVEALRPRLRRHRLWATMHRSEVFARVDAEALADLGAEFEPVALYGGEVLFRQGDEGDSLYIVVSGRLRVVSEADGAETVLAELGVGETVGEMAVLSGEPRSATVFAMRDSQLARLSREGVARIVARHPQSMLFMLTSRLVSRVRDMSRGRRRRADVTTIAVVPAAPGVNLHEFAARLATALSRLGRTLHLTSERVDRRFERPGASQAPDREGGTLGLVEWLAQQEVDYRFVLYQSDARLSPWTERCVRQADRVLLVADAAGDGAAGEIEAELLTRGSRRTPVTLALLHGDAAPAPTGSARWLKGRTLERHLHVRKSADADYERLSRFLTGNAIGLALGGGFARGLAHLGVLRALREANIPVDAIGGASMGALVGAQWVGGSESEGIIREMRTGFADSFDDMTLPFLSFKRGGKASRFIRGLFGDARIEDLWTPYFCVSANLNRAELKVHTSGSLADAVLASSRAPGIFPPVVIGGELHVDGGLINNVPVDVMRTFSNEGIVIGVDVSPPHELDHVADYGDDVPGWRAIWHRFNPTRGRRIYRPSILLVLMRVIEFGGISYRREKAALADVYISPDVLEFKRNDFPAADAIAEADYQASRERLREWLATASESLRARRPDLFA